MDSASSSTGPHLEMPTELKLDLAGLPGSFHLMFFPQMACEVQGREGFLEAEGLQCPLSVLPCNPLGHSAPKEIHKENSNIATSRVL